MCQKTAIGMARAITARGGTGRPLRLKGLPWKGSAIQKSLLLSSCSERTAVGAAVSGILPTDVAHTVTTWNRTPVGQNTIGSTTWSCILTECNYSPLLNSSYGFTVAQWTLWLLIDNLISSESSLSSLVGVDLIPPFLARGHPERLSDKSRVRMELPSVKQRYVGCGLKWPYLRWEA